MVLSSHNDVRARVKVLELTQLWRACTMVGKLVLWLLSSCDGVEIAEVMRRLSSSCGVVELVVCDVAQWLSTSCDGVELTQ